MRKKIAVTGGIGSGKSTIVKILREMGYPVFSCDEIYADLRENAVYLQKLSETFPQAVVNGRLDKKRLSSIVFNDSKQRERLNDLSHPIIMQTLFDLMNSQSEPLVFAEVPLLFENGFEKDFNAVIVIRRNLNGRINAICQRDSLSRGEALQRIRAQFDYDDLDNQNYLRSINAYFIQNDGSKSDLQKKVTDMLKTL